jgi:hypothetical protein
MRLMSYTARACTRKLNRKLRKAIALDQEAMTNPNPEKRKILIDEAIALKKGARTDMVN